MNPKVISLLEEILSILTKDELKQKIRNKYADINWDAIAINEPKQTLANEELEDNGWKMSNTKIESIEDFNNRIKKQLDKVDYNFNPDDFLKAQPKKEYEILTCENNVFGIHDYVSEKESNTPCLKPNKPCKIHSVKRLSDGEVFNLNDIFYVETNK